MRLPFKKLPSNPQRAAGWLMYRWHHRDGLPEIVLGIYFLMMAVLTFLQAQMKEGSNAYNAVFLIWIFLFVSLASVSVWLPVLIRKRFLLERVGYFEPRAASRRKRLVRIIAIATIGVVSLIAVPFLAPLLDLHRLFADMGPDAMLMIACVAAFVLCSRMPRSFAGGAILAVLGIFLAQSGLPPDEGLAILWGVAGLLALISGSVTLTRFLRASAEPGE